jgi:predicted DCC family thiol-disulfide oxidoreductase YuxK
VTVNRILTCFLYDQIMQEQSSTSPTVYYDGGCPVCTREIALYQRQDGADQVCWVDVAHCAPEALGPGLNREAAMARLHMRRADGTLASGAEAFTLLWRSLPRWAWLGRLLGSRVALALLEPAYRLFLAMRPLWRGRGGKR